MLFLCGPVPWPELIGCWRLFWPCMLKCCKHYVLVAMQWLLSQKRHWSVCVGFLYTVVLMVVLGPGMILVSKNGMEPSCAGSSTVNCMLRFCESIC